MGLPSRSSLAVDAAGGGGDDDDDDDILPWSADPECAWRWIGFDYWGKEGRRWIWGLRGEAMSVAVVFFSLLLFKSAHTLSSPLVSLESRL